ncbi:zinc finger protein 92 homolog isoform X7 [Lineus longissimus]|uniref:zinc finger protein 92 homolog isoform X7 n=1 Tax=Lineus longissimus TaxID=88925 RepID=UPI002B4E5D82
MDALETEHDHPIPQNLGQEAGTLPTTCSAAIGSAEMSGSVTETGGTFPGEVPPLVMVDTPRDDSSHSELSDVQPNSPSVIHLEPGFSLVANSIVVVKCDFGSIKPQTYTYNFTIVNTTTELIELNYQPIMRPPPFQQEQQTPEPIIPLPGVIHSAESVSGLRIPIPRFGGGMSSKHGKVVKEEPVDFSITMNVSSDTEMDTLHDFGGDMTSDSLDSQRQCLNTSDRTSTTTLQDQAVGVPPEAHSRKRSAAQLPSARISSAAGTVHKSVKGTTDRRLKKKSKDKQADLSTAGTPGTKIVKDLKNICGICGKEFARFQGLKCHLVTHSEERHYKCPHCEKRFKTGGVLKNHIRIHTKERPYVCEICGKSYTRTTSYRYHQLSHTGERPHKCTFCDKTYKVLVALNDHINSIHTKEKEYICEICGAVFLNIPSLNSHRHTHEPKSTEKPFQCEYCVKMFRRKELLVVHTRIHTGEKPFKCRHCEKFFTTCSLRVVHERCHTGEKPFQCSHCGKAFRQRGAWKEHLNIHTGERPFKCTLCEKSFAAKATLRNHQKMHGRFPGGNN